MVCYGKAALGVSKGGDPPSCFPLCCANPLENISGGLWEGVRRLKDVFEHERHPVGGNLGERRWIILSFQMCSERP